MKVKIVVGTLNWPSHLITDNAVIPSAKVVLLTHNATSFH